MRHLILLGFLLILFISCKRENENLSATSSLAKIVLQDSIFTTTSKGVIENLAENETGINQETIDLIKTRKKINRLLKTENWSFFKTPELFGDRFYYSGEFYGEPENNRTMDLMVLIEDSLGKVKLLLIDNFNYDGDEKFEFIEFDGHNEFEWVGNFKPVRKGKPIWSNWIEGENEEGIRDFADVPKSEIIYLNYDAIYLHAGESCGGGFIFRKNGRWNWLQQE